MTTETVQRNEAAERLRIGLHNASPENFDYVRAVARSDVELALATERRLTVERIRGRVVREVGSTGWVDFASDSIRLVAILDEVVDRP